MPATSVTTSSESSRPLAVANKALDGFVELRSKGVGLDMCMKTACWTMRLVAAVSDDGKHPERVAWANTLVTAIIDERMMFNQWKWLSTGRNSIETGKQFLKVATCDKEKKILSAECAGTKNGIHRSAIEATALSTPPSAELATPPKPSTPTSQTEVTVAATLAKLTALFTFLTYFSRTFEQVQGDIGFWNRFVFKHWNSKVHSRRYKLFKSISLTMSLVVEVLKIIDFRKKLNDAAAKNVDPPSVSATPVTRGSASFDHSLGITDLKQKLRKSVILLIRNIGDMIIYYQWIESYKPNKVLCSLCGIFSGLVGVYLVWSDNLKIKNEAEKKTKIA